MSILNDYLIPGIDLSDYDRYHMTEEEEMEYLISIDKETQEQYEELQLDPWMEITERDDILPY
ncbi:hypothetical protein GS608_23820 [Escherichia coli]|nr:hypothetical protein [Escherichia coli]EIA6877049.1 hypothetical protein [Escherichia coli]EIG7803117.1 hypothetical protein [Escherichia coli]EIH4519075.1 hypothetical protein [Escherichia coli]EIH6354756.1 hypothetical protein [Escherichia coli]